MNLGGKKRKTNGIIGPYNTHCHAAFQVFDSFVQHFCYLLYDRCLHAARLHLLLQEDLLLRLRDDVLSPVGSAHHLQDLT